MRLKTVSIPRNADGHTIIPVHLEKQRVGYRGYCFRCRRGYLTLLFEIDALVLNDDRHLNNIAVIAKGSKFAYCPIFDQGAGFLSNMMYSPMHIIPKTLIVDAQARPFHTTFNRQIRTMQGMYGKQLYIPRFARRELNKMLEPLLTYYAARDRELIADHVCETTLTRQKQIE